jgi:hypothetical protein
MNSQTGRFAAPVARSERIEHLANGAASNQCDPSGIRRASKQHERKREIAVSDGEARSGISEKSRRYVER